MALSMSDGAGSRANGSQPITRPFSTSAVKAPQWASEGKRATVMAVPDLGRITTQNGPFAHETQLVGAGDGAFKAAPHLYVGAKYP